MLKKVLEFGSCLAFLLGGAGLLYVVVPRGTEEWDPIAMMLAALSVISIALGVLGLALLLLESPRRWVGAALIAVGSRLYPQAAPRQRKLAKHYREVIDALLTWTYRRREWSGLSPRGRTVEGAPEEYGQPVYDLFGIKAKYDRRTPVIGEPDYEGPPEPERHPGAVPMHGINVRCTGCQWEGPITDFERHKSPPPTGPAIWGPSAALKTVAVPSPVDVGGEAEVVSDVDQVPLDPHARPPMAQGLARQDWDAKHGDYCDRLREVILSGQVLRGQLVDLPENVDPTTLVSEWKPKVDAWIRKTFHPFTDIYWGSGRQAWIGSQAAANRTEHENRALPPEARKKLVGLVGGRLAWLEKQGQDHGCRTRPRREPPKAATQPPPTPKVVPSPVASEPQSASSAQIKHRLLPKVLRMPLFDGDADTDCACGWSGRRQDWDAHRKQFP